MFDHFRLRVIWILGALAGLAISGGVVSTSMAAAAGAVPTFIADFDNVDTAGESPARTAHHAARVESFARMLRTDIAKEKFTLVPTRCPNSPCSAASMSGEGLIRAARQVGARLLVYGGLHKQSTLVAWGKVEALDLQKNKLVLNQNFTFRGDTDLAFRRAAAFVAGYLVNLKLDP